MSSLPVADCPAARSDAGLGVGAGARPGARQRLLAALPARVRRRAGPVSRLVRATTRPPLLLQPAGYDPRYTLSCEGRSTVQLFPAATTVAGSASARATRRGVRRPPRGDRPANAALSTTSARSTQQATSAAASYASPSAEARRSAAAGWAPRPRPPASACWPGRYRAAELERGEIRHALLHDGCLCDNGQAVPPEPRRRRAAVLRTSAEPIDDAAAYGHPLPTRDEPLRTRRRLPLPRFKRAILHAMARYGMFVGDAGGSRLGAAARSGAAYARLRRARPAA